MSNIAEGFDRGSRPEFHKFLVIAKGSCAEVRSQLYVALDCGYVTQQDFDATLGANCTVVCGVTIGEFAFIGAGAVVNKDVKPYALMVGVPARQVGWMSEYGEQIPLPLQGDGRYTCPHSGQIYVLQNESLTRSIK